MKHLDKIKAKLQAGEPVIGTHIKSDEPTIAELLGTPGSILSGLTGNTPS